MQRDVTINLQYDIVYNIHISIHYEQHILKQLNAKPPAYKHVQYYQGLGNA